ncbi:hypothetical protein D3C71_869380 [compost metagenome]
MNGDQGRHAEAALVLFTHLGTRALGRHHDDGDVGTDLLTLFHHVETVGITQGGTLLHQRHDCLHHVGVLLVRGQVQYQISGRDQIFIGTNHEAVVGGLLPGGALLGDGGLAQGIGDVQPGVAHVQALVQTLGATAHNHHLLALERRTTVSELLALHETTLAQLGQLLTQVQGVEIVSHGDCSVRLIPCRVAALSKPL